MKQIITVFGSSKPINNEEQYITAYNLGKKLALNGFDICTGGFNGIMEAASKGAAEGGGEAIGVTVNLWGRQLNKYITREIKCSTLLERVQKLVELGDGFVVLQGGTGTLLELAVVWEYINKGLMSVKPIACHSSIWKTIVSEMNEQMKLEGRDPDMVKTFDTVDRVVEYLNRNL
ncbi:MAG: LOG family protein [Ignavibacteriaceae bacterium]|nr:LOG family protein [Ignavibacteriaceae bacterium]